MNFSLVPAGLQLLSGYVTHIYNWLHFSVLKSPVKSCLRVKVTCKQFLLVHYGVSINDEKVACNSSKYYNLFLKNFDFFHHKTATFNSL